MVFLSEHLPHDRPHTVEDVDAIPPAMLAQARPLVITPVALPAQARHLVITPVTLMPTGASPSLSLPLPLPLPLPVALPLSRWRRMPTGASPSCSTRYRTTTPSRSRAYSGWSSSSRHATPP